MTTPASSDTATATADERAQVTIRLDGKTVTIAAQPGETILESARWPGWRRRSPCEAVATCGTCMAVDRGHRDHAGQRRPDDDEVDEGYVLTCQGVPDCSVDVDYDC